MSRTASPSASVFPMAMNECECERCPRLDVDPSGSLELTIITKSVLFVKPKDKLTPAVVKRIRDGIRTALSSRHVPAKIITVDRIPCEKRFSCISLKGFGFTSLFRHDEREAPRGPWLCCSKPALVSLTNFARSQVATKKLVNGIAYSSVNLSSAEDPEVCSSGFPHEGCG